MENPETKVKQFYVYKILIPCCSCPCKYKDTSSGRKQEFLTQGIHGGTRSDTLITTMWKKFRYWKKMSSWVVAEFCFVCYFHGLICKPVLLMSLRCPWWSKNKLATLKLEKSPGAITEQTTKIPGKSNKMSWITANNMFTDYLMWKVQINCIEVEC